MRITATEEYGMRCLVLLAKQRGREPFTLADIGGGEGLSQPYAAKIMNLLRQAGLVDSVRGRKGGYVLARDPETVKLSDVFDALGEPLFGPSHCEKYSNDEDDRCVHHDDCNVRDVWAGLNRLIAALLSQITLADLVREADGRKINLLDIAREHLNRHQPSDSK